MAHFARRGLLEEAALAADEDPDRLSEGPAVRLIRRPLPRAVAIPPWAQESLSSGGPGRVVGGAGDLPSRPAPAARNHPQVVY